MTRRFASGWSETPPSALRCPTHGIMMVDGRTAEGKPDPGRYCAICTPLVVVDAVRALYEPQNKPASGWIPEDL